MDGFTAAGALLGDSEEFGAVLLDYLAHSKLADSADAADEIAEILDNSRCDVLRSTHDVHAFLAWKEKSTFEMMAEVQTGLLRLRALEEVQWARLLFDLARKGSTDYYPLKYISPFWGSTMLFINRDDESRVIQPVIESRVSIAQPYLAAACAAAPAGLHAMISKNIRGPWRIVAIDAEVFAHSSS